MAKAIGQRVHYKDLPQGGSGVIVTSQFDGSNDRQECQVQWDDGNKTWEMGADLSTEPNRTGDAFVSMGNGFGVRASETSPELPDLRANQTTEAELFLRERFGLLKVRHPVEIPKDRQLTLDIRMRTRTGTPTRGSVQRPDKRKLALAAAVAAGQAQLVRRGRLFLSVPKGWMVKKDHYTGEYYYDTAKAVKRRLTLVQKRRLKAAKRRNKK